MNVYAPLTLSMYSDQDHSQEMTMTVSVVGGTSQLNQCNQDNPPTDMLRVPSPLWFYTLSSWQLTLTQLAWFKKKKEWIHIEFSRKKRLTHCCSKHVECYAVFTEGTELKCTYNTHVSQNQAPLLWCVGTGPCLETSNWDLCVRKRKIQISRQLLCFIDYFTGTLESTNIKKKTDNGIRFNKDYMWTSKGDFSCPETRLMA